ncbi:MAG: hypothetical protein ACI8T1_004531 [Verrucomicrobiales bacterium]|jgi:hypothetical protein
MGKKLFRFFSSIKLAIVVLLFLLLITWIGTEEQPEKGLFLVQEEYFNAWGLMHTFQMPILGDVTLPMPGVMLLLTIFSINLICGGLIMIRKSWRTAGVMIGHFSMLFLLAGGLLQHRYAKDGYMQLFEGESSNEFISYHDWVLRVHQVKDGQADFEKESLIVPSSVLKEFESGERQVELEGIPFHLRLYHPSMNAEVMPGAFHRPGELPVVGDVFVRSLPRAKESEANAAALYVDVIDEKGGVVQTGILWGNENQPLTVRVNDQAWLLKLDRERWKMPFEVALDKFTHELHPNTLSPKVYKSDVTKTKAGNAEKMIIEMNEPLRDSGYIVFQSGYGPQDSSGKIIQGQTPFSVFAVWRNPTSKILLIPVEHWPLVTVSIAAVGMLLHFLLKLFRHLAPGKRNVTPA